MNRTDFAGLHRSHLVRRPTDWKMLPGDLGRGSLERFRGGIEAGPVPERPFPFTLLQEAQLRGERVVVERRLDLEDLDARLGYQLSHPPVRGVQLRAVHVHERAALLHRPDVVVVAEALVAGEAGRDRLVAAVHRHEIHVDVDEQVALHGSPVQLDVLALVGQPEIDEIRRVLGIVLQEEPVRGEGVEDPRPRAWRSSSSVIRR